MCLLIIIMLIILIIIIYKDYIIYVIIENCVQTFCAAIFKIVQHIHLCTYIYIQYTIFLVCWSYTQCKCRCYLQDFIGSPCLLGQ